jgi:hypothetical protein
MGLRYIGFTGYDVGVSRIGFKVRDERRIKKDFRYKVKSLGLRF